MSISTKFQTFTSNILISQESIDNISYRYKRITKALNEKYYKSSSETLHSLYVGSYGRDTDIHTSDVDMLFFLPDSEYNRFNNYSGNGQSALLQEVKTAISGTYSSTKLRGDGQVVVISFSDGIIFEVVPCFELSDNSFKYPDTNDGGKWKITNPRPEINQIKSTNNNTNNNLKRLCRMVRAWKDNVNLSMGGLFIDTLCYNFIVNWEYKDKSYLFYDWMTRDFFKYLSEQNPLQSYWLAVGSSQWVFKKDAFIGKAKTAYDNALLAMEKESEGYTYTANTYWQNIYGTKFTG